MIEILRCCVVFFVFFMVAQRSNGVVLPPKYKTMVQSKNTLREVFIQVNGRHHVVGSNDVLRVLPSDTVRVVKANLSSGDEASAVNIVGFRNPKGHAADQGYDVRIKGLERYWELKDPEQSYLVVASTAREVHGWFYLKKLDAHQVFSVRYRINGQDRVVHPGDEITLCETDEIQIIDVSSVLKHEDMHVEMGPKSKSLEGRGYHQDMLITLPEQGVVARVGLKIKDGK
ncbi:MAG: hypothetical protein AB8C84_09615 [Oligoflexales bacterium]